ncbi:MAG: hypothetical protein ACOYBR_09655 [Fluviibacter sp.]
MKPDQTTPGSASGPLAGNAAWTDGQFRAGYEFMAAEMLAAAIERPDPRGLWLAWYAIHARPETRYQAGSRAAMADAARAMGRFAITADELTAIDADYAVECASRGVRDAELPG